MINKAEKRPIIFTAYSKHYFFAKMLISSYVLNKDFIPLNPFTNYGYFMDDMVDRDLVVRGNNNFVMLSDELWTFGPIADGVFQEVRLANSLGKPIRHFSVGKKMEDIRNISHDELVFEEELLSKIGRKDIHKEFGIRVKEGES